MGIAAKPEGSAMLAAEELAVELLDDREEEEALFELALLEDDD